MEYQMSEETLGSTIFALPTNWDDIKEDQPVEPNWYSVIIAEAEMKLSKEKRNPMISGKLEIQGAPEGTAPIFFNVMLPYQGCHKFIIQNLKRFLQAFEVTAAPGDQLDVNSLNGLSATLWLDRVKNVNDRWVNEPKWPDIAS
jgi:hypothetical protein